MVKKIIRWLDGKVTKQKKTSYKEISCVTWTVHKEISEDFQKNKETNPFPQYKRYTELLNKLTPDRQREMKENIIISADGKIEIIKMKKKFSILTAEHNGIDVFKGEYEDRIGRTATKWVIYFTPEAAERECKLQNKKLLKNQSELEMFINFFPGKNEQERMENFRKLFDLRYTGWRDVDNDMWNAMSLWEVGSLTLAKEGNTIYGMGYDFGGCHMGQGGQWNTAVQYMAYEDC